TALGCVQPTNQGCALMATVNTDGDDAIFGDLGNDWMVGGTGKDTIWAGWGNDLSNADDDLRTNDWLNDIPKGSNYTSATDTSRSDTRRHRGVPRLPHSLFQGLRGQHGSDLRRRTERPSGSLARRRGKREHWIQYT